MCTRHKQDDKRCNLHLIYNPKKQVDEEKRTYSSIEKFEKELKALTVVP